MCVVLLNKYLLAVSDSSLLFMTTICSSYVCGKIYGHCSVYYEISRIYYATYGNNTWLNETGQSEPQLGPEIYMPLDNK